MCDRSDSYANAISRRRIAGICSVLGWQSIQSSALQVMGDFLGMYIQQIGHTAKESAEVCNRSAINISDLDFTFKQMGISISELEDYVNNFASTGLDTSPVVAFPAQSEIRLNFLKPGSREVLHRKMHIYDYLPPMFPELETANSPTGGSPTVVSAREMNESNLDLADNDSSSNYPDNLPLREISSVMMTSAGFISPAREGKLPESRTPLASTKEVTVKKEVKALAMPPPKSSPLIRDSSKDHINVESTSNMQVKDKKLSVFKKKVKTFSSEKSTVLLPDRKDHTDDVINSVIERGVIESECIDKETKLTIKRKKKELKTEAKKSKEEVLCLPPPPPAHVIVKPFLSENPLIPKQLYGFGVETEKRQEVNYPDSSGSYQKKEEAKEKSMKKKRSKKEKEKHESGDIKAVKKDKKDKKKKLEKLKLEKIEKSEKTEKSDKSVKTSMKIKFKDSSVEKITLPPPLPLPTKVILKNIEPKNHGKKFAPQTSVFQTEPELFQEPIKLERPSTSSEDIKKPKRGRPEKKDKDKLNKKKKEKEDAKYEGGGCITTQTVGHYIDAEGNQIWICPSCSKQDDGSPMIGCDECDDWYHWLCVGIQQEPEETQNWFCQRCVARKQREGMVASKVIKKSKSQRLC